MRNKLLRMGFAAVMAAVLAGCSFGPQPAAVEESVSSQMTEEEFVQELEELPLLVAANALPEDQLFQTADFRFYTQQDSFATYDIWQLEQCQQELAALVLGEEVTDPAQMERLSQGQPGGLDLWRPDGRLQLSDSAAAGWGRVFFGY